MLRIPDLRFIYCTFQIESFHHSLLGFGLIIWSRSLSWGCDVRLVYDIVLGCKRCALKGAHSPWNESRRIKSLFFSIIFIHEIFVRQDIYKFETYQKANLYTLYALAIGFDKADNEFGSVCNFSCKASRFGLDGSLPAVIYFISVD